MSTAIGTSMGRSTVWIVIPLLSITLLGGSGFLSALESTTRSSVALAKASEEAPEATRVAAAEVESLPAIADLTTQQAAAFKTLADALELSSQRVETVAGSVDEQLEALRGLRDQIVSVGSDVGCIKTRLKGLLATSRRTPPLLRNITTTIQALTVWQQKSLRHLRSINRKLTALGAAATATGVKAPPPPPDAPAPGPGAAPDPVSC